MFIGIRHPKLVVVTGAGSGIGRATALRFARNGAEVIVTDFNEQTAQETGAQILEKGGQASVYPLDVTDRVAWADLAATVLERHGTPDVLVNNAGIVVIGGFLDQSKEAWDRQLNVNFNGVVNGCRTFAPLMAQAQRGQIVNISSVMAFTPLPMEPSYNVAKAGVRTFSECLRTELAEFGVGVSVVCPGAAATGIVGAGDIRTDTGLDAERLARLQRMAGEYVVKYGPMLGFGPDTIAKGIVRATRYNWAIVPVRPEAWAMYAASRIAPRVYRFLLGQVRPGRATGLAQLGVRLVPERVLRFADARADAATARASR